MILHPDGRREERLLPDITANRRAMFAAVLAKLHSPATVVCTIGLAERNTAFVEAVHASAQVQTRATGAGPSTGTLPPPVLPPSPSSKASKPPSPTPSPPNASFIKPGLGSKEAAV